MSHAGLSAAADRFVRVAVAYQALAEHHAGDGDILGAYARLCLGQIREGDAEMIMDAETCS